MERLAEHYFVLVENDSSLESCAQLSEFFGIFGLRHEARLQTFHYGSRWKVSNERERCQWI